MAVLDDRLFLVLFALMLGVPIYLTTRSVVLATGPFPVVAAVALVFDALYERYVL